MLSTLGPVWLSSFKLWLRATLSEEQQIVSSPSCPIILLGGRKTIHVNSDATLQDVKGAEARRSCAKHALRLRLEAHG